ncbi:hypothetical protein VP1G_07566 [Cytospora mali]|uniref:Uncharacterized protein n=1 Tax=Cytospora mali TaxID=578113 RepID=A0A194V967_CYTMA|nr:hypothetical protein VP1G_07566 [Valsa mali var. pyri (nom. inval.)]
MAFGGLNPSKQTVIVTTVLLVLLWYLTLFQPSAPITTKNTETLEIDTQPPAAGAGEHLEVDASTPGKPGGHPDVAAAAAKPNKKPVNPYITEGQLNPSGRPLEGPLSPPADDPWRPLILYAYSDTPVARDNLRFFLRHGLHAAADFIFILNGMNNVTAQELMIPQGASNIRTVLRPNTCYDLGAYGEVLRGDLISMGLGPGRIELYRRYKRFIMLNSSVRGPFLPHWGQGACWTELFLSKVNIDTKLVGLTANCWPHFHVQSEVWATDFVGMELLMHPPPPGPNSTVDSFAGRDEPVGLAGCYPDLGATRIMFEAGWKVDLMMTAFHGIANYTTVCNPQEHGDLLFNGKYFGTNVHPYETVFAKSNRDIDPLLMQRLSEWQWASGWRSWDSCGGWSEW